MANTSNSVSTNRINDDAVTLAKMASGTAGNLITYDASGNPAAVATGSAGEVLTSNGAGLAPTMQTLTIPSAATQAELETASSTTVYSSPGRQQYHPGHPKAWLYTTYSGGTPQITAGYNVASLGDTGVGTITINWDTSFSSADYACTAMGEQNTGTPERCVWMTDEGASRAAGSIIVECEAGGTLGVDRPGNFIACGDQ